MTEDVLDRACARLESHLPRPIRRAFHWVRGPSARLVRIPIGIVCIFGGFLWFLPILGIWMLPVGLLLLAEDVKPMRRPVGRAILWMVERYEGLKARFN